MSRREQRIQVAIAALDALDSNDQEVSHSAADTILLEVLRDARLGAVADAWERARERITFWYA